MITVKIPYVHEDVDRHGNVRIYFWRKGQRKVRMRETPGTEAFEKRYRELLNESEQGLLRPVVGPSRADPGTWRWLCIQYFGSSTFKMLDPKTQATRRRILERTFEEPIFPSAPQIFADVPINHFTGKHVRVLRDRKLKLPNAANGRVKCIGYVFSWAVEEQPQLARANPARDVPLLKTASNGYHSWTLEEVAQYERRHPIGTKARLALALIMFTGVRRSDAVRLGRQHTQNGWFKFRQFKNRNRHPVDIEIPVLPDLQHIIDASPTGDLTYLITEYGRPFTAEGFGNKMREWCNEAGLTHCSAHGLRKAGAAIAAENGASELQLMSIFGWKTIQEAERYTRAARRKKMAGDAMPLMLRPKQAAEAKSGTRVSHRRRGSVSHHT